MHSCCVSESNYLAKIIREELCRKWHCISLFFFCEDACTAHSKCKNTYFVYLITDKCLLEMRNKRMDKLKQHISNKLNDFSLSPHTVKRCLWKEVMFQHQPNLELRSILHTTHLTLQQAHKEAGQCHWEDWLGAQVGQDRSEGCHRTPGCCRQEEDFLTSNPADTQHRLY